jgi:hypothetical protein
LPQSCSFAFIREIDMAITAKRRSKSIITLSEFQSANHGYLELTVSYWEQSDTARFEAITWDGKPCSILKGTYVAPFTCSLLHDSAYLVASVLMDMTWRIIRLHVASILTAVLGNFGSNLKRNFAFQTVNHLISGISFHDSTSEKMRGK